MRRTNRIFRRDLNPLSFDSESPQKKIKLAQDVSRNQRLFNVIYNDLLKNEKNLKMLIIDYNNDGAISVLSFIKIKNVNDLFIFIRLLLTVFQIIFFALDQIFDVSNIEFQFLNTL